MRSVFRLLAVRKDAGFGNPYYLLEARERSLTLAVLPPRRWMGTWMLFFLLCMVPFVAVLFSATALAAQFYPTARVTADFAFSPLLILFTILAYGWSQRLAWRFTKISEKSLHPRIKDIKRGIFSSTLTVETEEGEMSLVVHARNRTIVRTLKLAG